MNLWHDVAPHRVRPEDFLAVIEIEKGSKNKYEMDKETGALRLDRILYTSTHYPANYGFLPRTWADDGDPLDVLVLCSECIRPLSLVECYPIGVITMEDGGSLDEKIIAIPFQDPTYNTYQDISELPDHVASEIKHFFRVYKSLEGKETVPAGNAARSGAEAQRHYGRARHWHGGAAGRRGEDLSDGVRRGARAAPLPRAGTARHAEALRRGAA